MEVENLNLELSYIQPLQAEFARRKAKNQSYSLNAFSKNLGIDQSLLSKILSGKKKISARMAKELLLKAGLSEKKVSGFLNGFQDVTDKEFEFLSAWLPFAILELMKTQSFEFDVSKIAKKLKVHKTEVQNAIGLLERFGYIESENQKQIVLKKPNNTWANTKESSVARKNLQRKYVEMSLEALDEIPFELREHGSLTIAINKKQIPEVKEKMNQFRMELGRSLQKQNTLDEVYQLTMSFFPLTKLSGVNDEKK